MKKFGRVCKEYVVKEIGLRLKDYPDFFLTSFSKIEVGEIEKFRKDLRADSTAYMVVKNTMFKHAIREFGRGVDLNEMKPLISGLCGIVFSKDDPASVARSLMNFRKGHESFNIQGAFVNGEMMASDTIKLLATLPSRKVLLSIVAAGVKAPITRFVGIGSNLLRNMVGVINAIKDKKGTS